LTDGWKLRFFSIWIAQAGSMAGSRLAQFALVWWLTEQTRSATVLALATLAAILPGVLIGPFAGVLVDRWDRRKVMIAADAFVALVALWVAILFWRGSATVWHVYGAMLARSLGEAFHWPSMYSSTSLMVPEKQLSRIAGLNQTAQGVLGVGAPPLAALLLAFLPMHQIMVVDMVTAAIAIGPLLVFAIPRPARNVQSNQDRKSMSGMRAGLRYLWSWPGLMAVIGMAMVINFVINPAFSLMPLLVTDHFGGGPLELGWLESAWGVGMVAGGLLLSVWGGFQSRILTALSALTLEGLAVAGVGLAPQGSLWLALAVLFAAGIMNPLVNGPFFALLQSAVAPELQGRVFSLVGSLTSAMMPLSLVMAGPLADRIGIRSWYTGGGLFITVLALGCFLVPSIMNLEQNHQSAAGSGKPTVSTAMLGRALD
jgi:DHA3 family macrolide efflux protein-like MFS transporter